MIDLLNMIHRFGLKAPLTDVCVLLIGPARVENFKRRTFTCNIVFSHFGIVTCKRSEYIFYHC